MIKNIFYNKQKQAEWLRNNRKYIKTKCRVKETEFVDKVFDEVFANKPYQKLHLYKEGLDCILANLIYYGRKELPLSKPNPLYIINEPWATSTIIDHILTDLTKAEYCIHWKGFKHPTNFRFSFSAKYFPSEKIVDRFLHIKNKKPDSCIILYKKDPKKRRVEKPYLKTWFSIKLNDQVNKINNILEKSTVKFKYKPSNYNHLYKPSFENQIGFLLDSNHIKLVDDQTYIHNKNIWLSTMYGTTLYFDNKYEFEINKESMYVYRSFNRGLFTYGGRFYTPVFQGIPSYWRDTLTIDDEETVEIDYSAHHIRLLYHKENLDYTGEPYIYSKDDKENSDKRTIQKYIAMIAINANDKKQSINAISKSIKDDHENGKYNSDIPTVKELELHYDNFIDHHKPISKYISNDAGIKLQRKDSDIMNEILVQLYLDNIVALPIHDSVIVQSKYKKQLEVEMTKQYYKLIKKYPSIS